MRSTDNAQGKLPLVAVLGPTAVGKTETAIAIAERWNGEIVSADSRLLYRGMDIGTAKPSAAELARVRHHLIDIANPDETLSLAVFQQQAVAAIANIHSRGKLPLLVGGTGQYMQAILEGWVPPALPPQPALRAALEQWRKQIGGDALHTRLAVLDPAAAANIDRRNVRRTLRALEVIFATGRRFSAQRGQAPSPYRVLRLGLTRPRPELYARIDARIDAMLAAGWLDEVRCLLAAGYAPSLPSLSAIGYAQLAQHLAGELTLDEAGTEIKRLTRSFVRRQYAWFKPADPDIHWVDLTQPGAERAIDTAIASFLDQASLG
ncbi:MAG TPA: tRNA (adenosine(37)-N6)-dimethylallyltransferase MiaA [Anaerolineales bacterium]|nr:tRNA (adenosine(37)-N6)-dimethylallyltransferase MiaA [Anaerolineales bacterium]HRQ92870.1 tRNA (adenosine(37)-N6)-dimethylallyltransferase MiaA [Anaerolineales bacterium]